ncbi:MAG: tRNA pseudouridine(38-40) synthase TruA [Rikenellaceae bacterium]|nr:tRNA pseudouridine(38-40) synthase TruA [Rikenellaceae bacterium]
MRYFLTLQYDGGAYFGWQRQKGQLAVQQVIEEALTTLLRLPTEVVGAGRTDTGVSAARYVAHFDVEREIADREQLIYKLNRILPRDIAVQDVQPVSDEAHARFSALEREYSYYIQAHKSPFMRDKVWYYPVALDLEKMNRAAEVLLEEEDFTTFAKLNSSNKTNICHIKVARWERLGDGTLRFTIRADRFLRNMVRAIVGTLVDVGRGRYTEEEFRAIVRSRDLSRSSSGAPAEGLYLSDVKYSETLFK